nr:pseudouridine synthase [Ndongobacter massiliensis]
MGSEGERAARVKKIRLDRWLSNMGYGSRREVKSWIQSGAVQVNGEVVTIPKQLVATDAQVCLDAQQIAYREYVYYLLHKPAGVLSATRDRRQTVLDLLNEADRRPNLFPVGRLDRDTTGLLLITDDGRLGHALLAPKNHIAKTYEAWVDEPLSEADQAAFLAGFDLQPEGIHTMPAQLKWFTPQHAYVTISEGKYHQVKRMFAFCGKTVLRLHRCAMGPLDLGNLPCGAYRPLTEQEVEALRQCVGL